MIMKMRTLASSQKLLKEQVRVYLKMIMVLYGVFWIMKQILKIHLRKMIYTHQ